MNAVQQIRLVNIQKMLKKVSRSYLCEMVRIEYNHLNQYLQKSSPKNVGGIFSARIANGLGLPSNWLDVPRDQYEISNALGIGFEQDSSFINGDSLYTVKEYSQVPFCDLNDSVSLDVIKHERLQQMRPLLKSYVYFKVDRSTPAVMYHGAIICCSGDLVPGSQSLFLFNDGTLLFAEYIYHREGYMNLVDNLGNRSDYCMTDLIYGSQIAVVLR